MVRPLVWRELAPDSIICLLSAVVLPSLSARAFAACSENPSRLEPAVEYPIVRFDQRIEIGDALAAAGLLVRRASTPIAALALAALLAGAVLIPTGGGYTRLSDLMPFEGILFGGGPWTLGAPLVVLLLCRALAVGIAATGWALFPVEHRAHLAALALGEEAEAPTTS